MSSLSDQTSPPIKLSLTSLASLDEEEFGFSQQTGAVVHHRRFHLIQRQLLTIRAIDHAAVTMRQNGQAETVVSGIHLCGVVQNRLQHFLWGKWSVVSRVHLCGLVLHCLQHFLWEEWSVVSRVHLCGLVLHHLQHFLWGNIVSRVHLCGLVLHHLQHFLWGNIVSRVHLCGLVLHHLQHFLWETLSVGSTCVVWCCIISSISCGENGQLSVGSTCVVWCCIISSISCGKHCQLSVGSTCVVWCCIISCISCGETLSVVCTELLSSLPPPSLTQLSPLHGPFALT